ncbi:MAG: hypothetical protein COU11_03725 [Candidatus Harrisonbacteria bacterium CG10_big_fil_rev_8_21_14_0_10_49_15]|uniref:Zinc-finger domain-containing protein n=1 Tax=Candidatus Harrisonbacteria bacterium CG10_big_fil_rev_8_21_14_0_10_49_15 TaxID=1974587 RepID=A0A2H0UK56_9BACT|nr:MAG: hypothetical protein COU11_03725 [Candidatus Harrisonbacteria bacterium CG10_big_fil_rev_8_21_14_0_10_49_15]
MYTPDRRYATSLDMPVKRCLGRKTRRQLQAFVRTWETANEDAEMRLHVDGCRACTKKARQMLVRIGTALMYAIK